MKFPKPFLLLLAVALLGSCAKESGALKIGEYGSLTGKEATFGQSAHKGIALAFEEIKSGESGTIARKLITRDKVIALLGEVSSGRSLEAAPIAQNAKIPMISPAATNERVTQIGDYIFRVCFIDPFQGTVMAKFAQTDLKVKNVAIFSSVSNPYSVGLAKAFRDTFTAAGGNVAIEQKYNEGDRDFRAHLTAIRAANVEAVFLPGYYTEAALIVRQARDLGLTIPFFGGDGWESEKLLEIGGAALNGCYYSTHFSPNNNDPAVAKFVQKFKARWNGETPDAFAALGYDAAYVLADALKRAGTTEGPQLRDALAATKNFSGVTGVTNIDQDRNASKAATIIAIKDGKLEFLKTVAP
jgi:branched-chain amino acid transport system substrate-binding protein